MFIKYLFATFSLLPISVSQSIGGLIGRLLYYFDNREKRVAKINIDLCFPELSDKEKKTLLQKTLIESAKTLLEIPRIYKKGGAYAIGLVSEVSGIEHYHRALERGKGVVLLAPHLGNWEVTVYLNQFSPITAMYAPPKQVFLNDVMKKGRQSTGATLVPADTTGVRALLKQLKKGGVIGVLPDQKPKAGHAGAFAPFMGKAAYTMLLINSLMKRTDAVALMTFAERLPNGRGYCLHVMPAPKGLGNNDEVLAVTALNQGVEQCVRLAPSQYQWTYKRFSLQPEGMTPPY